MVTKPHKSAQRKVTSRGSSAAGSILSEAEVLEQLRAAGAITGGHFVLSSGRHSDVYVEKFRALEVPSLAVNLGASLADRFSGRAVDVVLAPALGAIVLGFTTALALGARFIFAERDAGEMRLRRGFSIRDGERALVIEDVVTTGKSLLEVLALVPDGALAGVGCLLNRSAQTGSALPPDLVSLATLDAPAWDPAACPLCAAGQPTVAPGSRHLSA